MLWVLWVLSLLSVLSVLSVLPVLCSAARQHTDSAHTTAAPLGLS